MATFSFVVLTAILAGDPLAAGAGTNLQTATTPASQADNVAGQKPARTPQQLRDAVHSALKIAATAEGAAKVEAVRELTNLLQELQADTQMAKDERGRQQTLIRSRLQKIDQEARLSVARQRKNEPAAVQAGGKEAAVGAADPAILGQQRPLAGAGQKPGQAGGQGGGVFKTQGHYSQQLIDIIQSTIAPGSWDVNGGNGSIKFFPGLNVMVIRNTAENQEDLVDVLQALRR